MFPIDRYKFYQAGNKTIAVSTYAGRAVKGVSKCDSRDTFSQEKGRELAAARCALKIAEKRVKRAEKKFAEAKDQFDKAQDWLEDMYEYKFTAKERLRFAQEHLRETLTKM